MFSVVEMFMMSSMRCLETGSPRLITMTDFMVGYESSSLIRATKWTKMAKGRLEDKMRYVSDLWNKKNVWKFYKYKYKIHRKFEKLNEPCLISTELHF